MRRYILASALGVGIAFAAAGCGGVGTEAQAGTAAPSSDYYEELIKAARDCRLEDLPEGTGGYGFSNVIYTKRDGLGYLVEDLDGDGTTELIFGENTADSNDAWDGIIYDVYTVCDGELAHVLDGWERNRYFLCENGMVANEGSSGAASSNYAYFTFDGRELRLVEAVIYDGERDREKPWFYSTESEHDAERAAPISEGQAEEIRGKYVYQHLKFIPFSGKK